MSSQSHFTHGNKPTDSTVPETKASHATSGVDQATALSNALSASVLPVGTATPGSNVASSLVREPGAAPSTKPGGAASTNSSNKVIVVFKAATPASEIEAAVKDCEAKGGKIVHRYNAALLGFSAEMPDVAVQTLNSHPHVDYVEPDGEVSIYAKNLLNK